MSLATFIQASAHNMPQVATGSVQCIVTSPPYYGLRKYEGAQDVEWPAVEYAPVPGLSPIRIAGCEPECEHEWEKQPSRKPGQVEQTKWKSASAAGDGQTQAMGSYCSKCGGWRGGLGNEPTLDAYIAHLILCLREWRRVLRDDGVCFVNLGDSYVGGGGFSPNSPSNLNGGSISSRQDSGSGSKPQGIRKVNGLKPKDLMLVPHRFALAAQADGWWVRSDIIGAKVAPMPESVTDRPTRSHEHIWMLTKAARYYWDAEAVREKAQERQYTTWEERKAQGEPLRRGDPGISGHVNRAASLASGPGRNMRDVIEWRPAPFPGSHFAVFPEAIPERFIRAATSERGACPHCGAPWARVVERGFTAHDGATESQYQVGTTANRLAMLRQAARANGEEYTNTKQTTGWQPSCICPAADPTPCLVLDPFSGSGTTAKVAVRLGRRAIGVDIAAEYLTDVTAQRFGAGVQMELTGGA